MSKGLGKLQKCILKEIYKCEGVMPPARSAIYFKVQEAYFGKAVIPMVGTVKGRILSFITLDETKELNRRRASISQSLGSLKDKGFVQDNLFFRGLVLLTEKGVEQAKKLIEEQKAEEITT
jgi:hypothetical protein